MRRSIPLGLVVCLALGGCSIPPFRSGSSSQGGSTPSTARSPGAGPVLTAPPEVTPPSAETAPVIEAPPPAPLPRERPRVAPATLSPASRSLVSQAQAQRRRGDLPGATVSLERALRIEPSNPLLWIEMGRLRMDQRNYPQAENMGRKALSMAVGDSQTQSSAWLLIADSLKARDRNPQAQEAYDRAEALTEQ